MPSTPTEAKTLNLTALIERLEKADGPDQILDNDIEWELSDWINIGGWWRKHKVTGEQQRYSYKDAPLYTASIDAAVALAERVLPEMSEIHPRTYTGGKFHHCEIETDDGDFEASNCPNLALAICLATLRALSAQEGSPNA